MTSVNRATQAFVLGVTALKNNNIDLFNIVLQCMRVMRNALNAIAIGWQFLSVTQIRTSVLMPATPDTERRKPTLDGVNEM
jgi:hypothetical protein